jgi:hypothetical protein
VRPKHVEHIYDKGRGNEKEPKLRTGGKRNLKSQTYREQLDAAILDCE